MQDRAVIYDGFKRICADIANSRLIMFNGGLTNLLSYIAQNKPLMDFIKDCNVTVDYRKEFYEATNALNTAKCFKMPSDSRKIVALVTGILFAIDRSEIDFYKFLKTYFDVGDLNNCYEQFIKQVLLPYGDAFKAFVENIPIKLSLNENIETESKTSFEVVTEQILPYIEAIYASIYENNKLSEDKRREYTSILEGMCYALESENSKLVNYMWIGLKNTFYKYDAANNYLYGINNVLVKYGIMT